MPALTILVAYLYFVTTWGPNYMKHRKPYQLKHTLVIYNFLQVVISTYIVYQGLKIAWWSKYSWKCEPVDFSYSDHSLAVSKVKPSVAKVININTLTSKDFKKSKYVF